MYCSTIIGQSFYKAEKNTVNPSQLIAENYSIVELKWSGEKYFSSGLIDKNNMYTFIQYLRNANGVIFQILYQTDFLGNPNVIALSNNMNELFKCSGKPTLAFDYCAGKINENDFPEKITEDIINCILTRINNCR